MEDGMANLGQSQVSGSGRLSGSFCILGMMQKGDEVTLNIENLSGDGKTVARLDGMVFFVEKAVPGDVVRARVWKVKKNFADARAVEVLTPSPYRVAPK